MDINSKNPIENESGKSMEVDSFFPESKPWSTRTVLDQTRRWFDHACKIGKHNPNSLIVSTVDAHGIPSSRVVLCKEISKNGLIFYTNYLSKKGKDIDHQQKIAALFYWDFWFRQIKIHGTVSKISEQDSDAYWNSRPRDSQITQFISTQSDVAPDRKTMELKWTETNEKFLNKTIPRPPHWGGYCLRPTYVEFWIGRDGRFHDRFVYTSGSDQSHEDWSGVRLYP